MPTFRFHNRYICIFSRALLILMALVISGPVIAADPYLVTKPDPKLFINLVDVSDIDRRLNLYHYGFSKMRGRDRNIAEYLAAERLVNHISADCRWPYDLRKKGIYSFKAVLLDMADDYQSFMTSPDPDELRDEVQRFSTWVYEEQKKDHFCETHLAKMVRRYVEEHLERVAKTVPQRTDGSGNKETDLKSLKAICANYKNSTDGRSLRSVLSSIRDVNGSVASVLSQADCQSTSAGVDGIRIPMIQYAVENPRVTALHVKLIYDELKENGWSADIANVLNAQNSLGMTFLDYHLHAFKSNIKSYLKNGELEARYLESMEVIRYACHRGGKYFYNDSGRLYDGLLELKSACEKRTDSEKLSVAITLNKIRCLQSGKEIDCFHRR